MTTVYLPFAAGHADMFRGAPCTDPGHRFIWDARGENEPARFCERRHRKAQLLCATECPRLLECANWVAAQHDAHLPTHGVWAAQINPS